MADTETAEAPTENEVKEKRPPREGSTRLPPFPRVHIVRPKVGKKKINYNHVHALRDEMKNRLFKIDKKEKFDLDFKNTSADFWRMELDRLKKISDDNRRNMSAAVRVYLGQTKGSSKAIESLIKHIEPAPCQE